jgi:hypothetical protein
MVVSSSLAGALSSAIVSAPAIDRNEHGSQMAEDAAPGETQPVPAGRPPRRPDTPHYDQIASEDRRDEVASPPPWDSTLQRLDRAAVNGKSQNSSKNGDVKDRNLSGIVTATSKALKAALMENEELLARNAELEAKLTSGVAEDTDAGQIEQALSDASLALRERRREILVLQDQMTALQAENNVMLEAQTRLKAILSPPPQEGINVDNEVAAAIEQQSAEIVQLRAANQRLEEQKIDLLMLCDDLQLQIDSLQSAKEGSNTWSPISGEMVGLATIQEGSGATSPSNMSAASSTTSPRRSPVGFSQDHEHSAAIDALRLELHEAHQQHQREQQDQAAKHELEKQDLEKTLKSASIQIQELMASLASQQALGVEAQLKLDASAKEVAALRDECTQLRQRAESLTGAHEQMREKLAQSADGLSERIKEAREGRRELEQVSPPSLPIFLPPYLPPSLPSSLAVDYEACLDRDALQHAAWWEPWESHHTCAC